MKKAILLIAALLVCGSLAFAESSIGIWGRTVFNIASQSGGVGPVSMGWGPNWGGQNLTRMGINFSFSSKTLSFKITSYFNGAPNSAGSNGHNFDLVNMYGTCKVIPDMLTIIVGRVRGDGFDNFRKNQPNPNSDMNNNLGRMAGWGLWLVFAPKDLGLEIAVNMMTPYPGSEGLPYSVSWQMLGGYFAPYSWETQLHNINVAASYVIPDIMKITAAFMNQCPGDDTVVATGANETQYEIYGRIDVLAIQGLTLWVDAAYTGFETNNPKVALQFDLGAGYKIGDLGLYLAGKFMMPLAKIDANTNPMSVNVNLEAVYNIKPITVGLIAAFGYNMTAATNMQFEFQPYVTLDDISLRIAFDYLLNTDGTAGNWNVPILFTFSF